MAKKIGNLSRVADDFPECPHLNFFQCKSAKECLGCYYNPIREEAMWVEEDENKKPKDLWFYSSKKHASDRLKTLEDIRLGKGLRKGGNRCYFKHARKNKNDDE